LIRYKSRVVLLGYMQVPGVDYTESFSPVATDTTVRSTISLTLYREEEGWTIDMIDIEAAFLNADLENDNPVYAEWPEGMVELGFITEEERQKYCIKLNKAMYGGVDVPRLFMKTLKAHLVNKMKMVQSKVDPCLYFWRVNGETQVIAVVHVDDVAVAGKPEMIKRFKEGLTKRFNITDTGRLKKHLGIDYDWRKDEDGNTFIVASMDKLENEIVKECESTLGRTVREVNTPGVSGKYLSKNTGEAVRHNMYRRLVGKIMYLGKKLGPDITNASRELAQHLANPGKEHWTALERTVGNIKAKLYEGLIFRKPKELRSISIVDADYAKDLDDRKSISSGLHTIGGTLVNWESKKQDCVTLSSTESELYSLSKGACENKFITMLLDEVFRHASEKRLVGWMYEDNMGAIHLVKNQHVGARTKHIEVRIHHARELEEQGWILTLYVKSENNAADILNKHAVEKLHLKHARAIRNGTLDCWREDVEKKHLLYTNTGMNSVHQSAHVARSDTSSRTPSRTIKHGSNDESKTMKHGSDDVVKHELGRNQWTMVQRKERTRTNQERPKRGYEKGKEISKRDN
jgi:hypothetical protein